MVEKVFSAPGKALIAGGYLVLDAQYEAFVVALSARMHAVVSQVADAPMTTITVKSPQFKQGEWSYEFDIAQLPLRDLAEVNGRNNPFVKTTILAVLAYLSPKHNYDIVITMFSDPGYHSQQGSKAHSSTNGKTKFLYHTEKITDVPKTGLGSSAGLVTSLTTALLYAYNPDVELRQWLDRIHNLSQVAHCLAQGKVGSGFDVASAVYGSIVYRRFDPALINSLVDLEPADFCKGIKQLVDHTNWMISHKPCGIVKGIRILMGDIAGGSETPKLVAKVNKWHNADPQRADQTYTELNAANMTLVRCLNDLETVSEKDPEYYAKLLAYLDAHSSKDVLTSDHGFPELVATATALKSIRKWLKVMTVESGAEIEPDSQTQLLDNCETLPGCVGGVVPGAGGFDAICLLVSDSSIDNITSSTAGDARFENVNWLDLTEQNHGLIEENPDDFQGL